ncbi:MAG: PorV/PorQ family protein [Elusimicrobiota bacterium]
MILLTLIGLLNASAPAAFASDKAGTSSGEFLKFGADARGMAMGDAMTAVADDAAAIHWNPAGLSQLTRRHVAGTGALLYQDVFLGFIAAAFPVQPVIRHRRRLLRPSGLGAIAVGALYLNAGEIEEVNNTGAKTGGTFTPTDAAFMVGWGGTLTEILDLGLTVKYINSTIKASARTGAADAGLRLRLHVVDRPYVLALSAHNLGGSLRFHQQSAPLPTTFRIGQSIRAARPWLVSFDIVVPRDNDPYPAFGTEATFEIDDGLSTAVRGGWSGRTSSGDLDGMAGITFGAGMQLRDFGADYAWVPFGVLGHTHRVSLSYRF